MRRCRVCRRLTRQGTFEAKAYAIMTRLAGNGFQAMKAVIRSHWTQWENSPRRVSRMNLRR